MLTTALLLALAAAPGLTGAPRSVRLMDDGPASPYEGWTREQLAQRRLQLEDERPGIAVPIAMMAGGTATVALDVFIAAFGSFMGLFRGRTTPDQNAAMIGALAVGAVLIVGGAIYLIIQLVGLRTSNGQFLEVDEALENLVPTQPPGSPSRPPAMPPSQGRLLSQVNAPMQWLAVTLARF